jgi:hypothetical protein
LGEPWPALVSSPENIELVPQGQVLKDERLP